MAKLKYSLKEPIKNCLKPDLATSTARSHHKCRCTRCLEWDRERRLQYSEKYRLDKAKKKYGLTEEQIESLNGQCEICGNYPNGSQRERRLTIDHDHKTGKFRGALCHNCNIGLAKFRDNISWLGSAASYLWRYHEFNCM